MIQQSLNLFHIPFPELFERIKTKFQGFEYDFEKHSVNILNQNDEKAGFLRLPLYITIDNNLNILSENAQILYLSIESGNAAIILTNGKDIIYHTTFSAYMSRKKQGFSQIKYLNKKGKSRAGSRVRLAATIDFFENINRKNTELLEKYEISRIALDCSTTLIPYLHQSKIHSPFDKKDPRLYKIPLHLPQSNFTNLEAAFKKLMAPMFFFDENAERIIMEVFELKN